MTDLCKVLFDVSLLGNAPGVISKSGVVRTAEELAIELQSRSDIQLQFSGFWHWERMFTARDFVRNHPKLSSPFVRGPIQPLPEWTMQTAGRFLWRVPSLRRFSFALEDKRQSRLRSLTLPRDLKSFDVLHTPFYPFPKHIRDRRSKDRFATITMVHDLIPLRLPTYGNADNPHFQMVRAMVDSFDDQDWIVCDSNFTREDLLQESSKLDPSRVFVTPLGASERFRPTESARDELLCTLFGDNVSKETIYFVSLCSIEPRKNIQTVAKAFDQLTQTTDADVRLALVGVKTKLGGEVLNELTSLSCADRIHYVGALPDELLPAVYSAALGFVYLSIYEGFGLPPLEAMRCGTPTITSNATSLPEVVGDTGVSVDPMDADAVANAMLRLIEDPSLGTKLSNAGRERSKMFTWSETVRRTIEVYDAAYASLH